jgi:hypothetical protein
VFVILGLHAGIVCPGVLLPDELLDKTFNPYTSLDFAYNRACMAPECDESIAIVREVRDAISEAIKDPKTMEKAREFYSAFLALNEEMGPRLEWTFEKFPQWRAGETCPERTPIDRAMNRAGIHRLRTGHNLIKLLLGR